LKVLSFSYCFPNSARPTWGVFVLQRLAALARRPDVELQVVAPVPVFPILSGLRSNLPPAKDSIGGLAVHYPRFFYFPKVLKTFDGRLYGRGLIPWVRDFCRGFRPDVLDAHFEWPDAVGVSHIARALGIPYTVTLRGALWVYFRNENIKQQCVRALQDAAAIISLSDSMAQVCRESGVPREKFTVVHNGVSRALFHPGDRREARRKLNLPLEGHLVVSVSYYQKRKGIMELIRAMANLPENVRLVLVGSEVAREAAYYTDVVREIERLGMSRRVFRVGHQPHEKIPDYFRAADVSVLASYWEGCPNAVVESLACGTPVVATPVGAVPEIVVPGQNGQIVPMRNVEALAEALREVLAHDWQPEELSHSVNSWEEVADRVHEVLTRALSAGQADDGPATGELGRLLYMRGSGKQWETSVQ
jgi:teichuronic acid biosynthesis glycosyltransferase TuaC